MSEASKSAESTPARNAGRNIVTTTSETIAAMYSPPAPASEEASKEAPKEEVKTESQAEDNRKDGKKKGFQERISELVNQRNESKAKADAAERRAAELETRIKELQARPDPIKEEPRPSRDKFASDDQYLDALAEWKANQVIAKREKEKAEAEAKEAQEALAKAWVRRQKQAMAEIDDYSEVIGKSEIALPGHLHQAILESDIGPHLAYYFAKHPDEAKRFASMTPTTALRQLGKLEDQLTDIEEDPKEPKTAVEVSKAPPPVKPVKTEGPVTSTPKSFEEYRAKRQAERKR
jgi:hypothetical protein